MKYLFKFNENMNMAKSIVSKKLEGFDKLKDLLSKNLGYIGKFTQYLMEENVPYKELEDLYSKLVSLKNKNINIDINTFTYEKLIDKIQDSENDLDVNSVITEFPSEQKKIIKELLNSYNKETVYNALLKISKKENKKAFISKISRYKSSDEIINAIKIFSKDGRNDIESVKNYINNSQTSKVLVEKNNILIIKIDSIEDVKVLGSDTSWCILSEYNWNSYTKNRLQYILFDYNLDDINPKFKIGFTLNKDATIHAVHDILDSHSTEYFRKLLTDNQIELKDLIGEDLTDITNIVLSGKTSIANWKIVAEGISLEQSEEYLIKFLNIIGVAYDINMKMARPRKNLTEGQHEILKKFLIKISKNILNDPYLSSKEYILTIDQTEKLDPRIRYYLKTNNYILPSKEIPYKFGEDKINKYFDNFEPIAFIRLVKSIPGSIVYGWGSYSKEGELMLSVELLNKVYDIVSENINLVDNLENEQNKKDFYKGYAFLSKLLDKKNEYQKYLDINDVANHNNFFKEKIDLSKLKSLYYLKIKDFNWASYIIKKDYLDLQMNSVNPEVLNEILNHLEGYNVVIKVNSTLSQLKVKIRQKHTKINNQLLTNLPSRSSKKEFTSEDGMHKIILN